MTPDERAAIQARADAATPGPWSAWHATTEFVGWTVQVAAGWLFKQSDKANEHDAEFIAHARTDIPALLAEIERLSALLTDAGRETPAQNTVRTIRHLLSLIGHGPIASGVASERTKGKRELAQQVLAAMEAEAPAAQGAEGLIAEYDRRVETLGQGDCDAVTFARRSELTNLRPFINGLKRAALVSRTPAHKEPKC